MDKVNETKFKVIMKNPDGWKLYCTKLVKKGYIAIPSLAVHKEGNKLTRVIRTNAPATEVTHICIGQTHVENNKAEILEVR